MTSYQLRKDADESGIIRIFMDEEDIPELTGEALRRFQEEVNRFRNETGLGNKIVVEKKPKAMAQPKSPAPKLPDEQLEAAPKATAAKSKARPAGAEDVEMKPTDATQPKVPKLWPRIHLLRQSLLSRPGQCRGLFLLRTRLWHCSHVHFL